MKKPWTPENIKHAFDAVLTRSASDGVFRNRLTASPESAKKAVSEHGDIQIPKEVLIVFHEGQYNENYLVFWLPDFNKNTKTTHTAKFHFDCCYSSWLKYTRRLRAARRSGKS